MKYLSLFLAVHLGTAAWAFTSAPRAKQIHSPLFRSIHTNSINTNNNAFQKQTTESPPLTLHCAKPSLAAVAWVASSVLGGISGAPIVMKSTRTWYKTIPLPSFTPPNKLFAPVWSTLYTMLGIASWRIRNIVMKNVNAGAGMLPFLQKNIILLSLIHYAMNLSWAPTFFGLKRLRAGHILNVMLIATLLPIIGVYFSLDTVSGMLLLPYLAWLLVATRLSSEICRLNPTEVKNGYWYNNAKLQDQVWKLRKEAAKSIGL